jgi:hypothetical protein
MHSGPQDLEMYKLILDNNNKKKKKKKKQPFLGVLTKQLWKGNITFPCLSTGLHEHLSYHLADFCEIVHWVFLRT